MDTRTSETEAEPDVFSFCLLVFHLSLLLLVLLPFPARSCRFQDSWYSRHWSNVRERPESVGFLALERA